MQQQQQQPYGFSNNYGQIQTRPMYQQQPMYQQYQQQPYGNNFDNDSHPFAPPAGYQNNVGVMRYQNQNYNQPQPQFQPGYPNYSSPEDEDRPPGETNYQQRNGIGPNNIGLGLELQNNAARRNSGDAFKPETTNQGGSSWNKAQPDQDSSSKKNDPKPSTSKAYNIRQYSRRMTSFGVSNKSGICLSIFGLGGTIGVLGVIIALMTYHFGKKDVTLTSVSGGLDYMVFNLNADPIMELSWASSSCPWGTETIHLGKWPGTGDGCNCAVTGLSSGQCNDNSDSLTSTVANAILCSDYSDIDSRDIYKWENNAVFCVKRAQLGVDYVKAPSCGTGYKTCSAGLCFLNSLSCPITSVTFSNTGDSSSLLTTGKYVVVSRTSGAAPVIDFEASLNSWPCFSYNEIPKRNDGSKNGDYLLLKQRPKGCSKYGEDSLFSINIENKTQYDLLINNQFPSDVFKLPGYTSVLQGTTTLLTGRKRIDVNTQKDECLAIETETMNSAGDYAAKLNKYVSGTAITGMVLHSILVILVIVALCNLRAENGWKSALSGKEAGLWALPYVFFTFCELIVYIVMVALVKKARSHLIEAQEYLMGLDKLGCFPRGPPQLIIADYDEVVDDVASKLNGYAVALLALTILTFVPVIAILIYKSKKD